MRSSKVSTSLQKTYDECFLKCSTAVYFEGQSNEREAIRNWRTVENRITEFNAYGLPSGYRPRSETEKALQESLADMHLQAKERISLLEALRKSRADNANGIGSSSGFLQPPNINGIGPGPSNQQQPVGLGAGTVRPVDYSEISRPTPLSAPRPPPRPSISQSSIRPSSQLSSQPSPSASPSPFAAPTFPAQPRRASRTPSPNKEKRESGLRLTLRDGRDKKRDSKSRTSGHRKESGVAAAKAASQAWIRPGYAPNPLGQSLGPQAGSSGSVNPPNSQRQSLDETLSTQATRGDESPPSYRKYSSDYNTESQGSRNNSLSKSTSASFPYQQNAYDSVPPARRSERLDSSTGYQTWKQPAPPPPPPRHSRPLGSAPDSTQPTNPNTYKTSSANDTGRSAPRRKPVANSSSPRQSFSAGYKSRDKLTDFETTTTKPRRSPRKSTRKPRNTEDQASSETELTPSSSDSDRGIQDEEWNGQVESMMKRLPKGVDDQAAKQIFNEIVIHGDEVHWDDVAGLDVAKNALKEAVVYPFLRPDLFMGLREPARGMLLFGPPGTGKTMLARAVATESKSTFFSISASSLTSKYLGESEKLVRALFSLAKTLAPSIIFVDEIDSLLSTRSGSGEHEATRRIKTEFLIQWSDLQRAAAGSKQSSKDLEKGDASRVLVLAATNLPWAIDEAARRRFVRRQYIPLPEDHVRAQQLRTLIGHQKHELREADIAELVKLTEGFSGSDITALAKDAAMGPLRSLGEALLHMKMDQIRPIGIRDFKASLINIRPSVSKEGLRQFEDWAREFGERGG